MQGAWKVGVLVVVFVGLLIGAYAFLGQTMFKKPTSTFYAVFKDAGGVTQGTKVLVAGVKVGTVSEIKLDSPTQARLTLAIDEGITIPDGSTAYLPTALIGFGDNPLTIVPPASMTGARMAPKSVLVGIRGGALDNILPDTETTMKELNKTLVAVQTLLADKDMKGGVKDLLKSSEQTMQKFGTLAVRLDSVIVENQGTVQRALRSASTAMADIQKSTQLVAQMLGDERWKNKAMAMLDTLTETTAKAQTLITSLDQFVNDPKLRDPLAATAQNMQTITDRGTQIAANTEEMTKNGIEISKNGVELSSKAVEIANKASEIADEAKAVLQKLQGFFGKTPSTAGIGSITANLDLMRETDPGHTRTDIEVTVPFRDSKVHLGLWDAFESNKITLQLEKQFAPDAYLRYGIYASKPGVGVDYQVAPKLFLRGDFFDLNNPRADIRARYEFGNGFYGWLGVNQVLKRNAPLFGIGFRK